MVPFHWQQWLIPHQSVECSTITNFVEHNCLLNRSLWYYQVIEFKIDHAAKKYLAACQPLAVDCLISNQRG